MSLDAAPPTIARATPLAALPLVPTKVHLPRPVEMRLEGLVSQLMEQARDLGQVSRGDVVGALLLAREGDAELVADLRRYRGASAGDALPGRGQLRLPPRRRGRPPLPRG
jgi:hypothetical protein